MGLCLQNALCAAIPHQAGYNSEGRFRSAIAPTRDVMSSLPLWFVPNRTCEPG
jgi:hypothetical protein